MSKVKSEEAAERHGQSHWLRRRLGSLLGLAIVFIGGLLLGYAVRPAPSQHPISPSRSNPSDEQVKWWTCSMHPSVKSDVPGLCPICNMELIPMRGDAERETADRTFTASPAALALMQVEVQPVERRFVEAEIRMVGKVDYDETRLANITAWVPGRIDRLYVDYTGIQVRKGDHLVYLYSPELLTAQDDLRRAARTLASLRAESPAVVRDSAKATLEATRAKLKRWGLTDAQIAQAEGSGSLSDHVTISAPTGGTVIARQGQEGMYVETGTTLYTIADLSKVWVKLEAYESDLPWIHYGQSVTFTTESYPGETFEGTVSFIDPMLDPDTRTVAVRLNVSNTDGRLKPGMFVRAVVRSQIATGGRVMDAGLAGKWICPMHPEIVKDSQSGCDVCGMALVPAEKLGYVPLHPEAADMPLVIPATAPLITGKRAVVYLQHPNAAEPTYEGREIVLGPRAGAHYLVASGLSEGELVVTKGAFKIDSALQIQAKPSMMSSDDSGAEMEHAGHATPTPTVFHEATSAFRAGLGVFFSHYVRLQSALANDDRSAALDVLGTLREDLESIDVTGMPDASKAAWTLPRDAIQAALASVTADADIESLRKAFEPLSDGLTAAIQSFGTDTDRPIFRFHCPMALGDGAYWLQDNPDLRNPYYGAAMLTCGTQEETLQEGGSND